jgi:hypothetical protein
MSDWGRWRLVRFAFQSSRKTWRVVTRGFGMRYSWVNQHQTFGKEIARVDLCALERGANGARNPFWRPRTATLYRKECDIYTNDETGKE